MYDRILIPTDGSELADKAVDQGLGLAKVLGAKVAILRVTTVPAPMVYEGVVVALPTDELRVEIAARVAEHFATLKSKASAMGVDVETVHLEHDSPWQAIIDTAKDKATRPIVWASHGRRGLSAGLHSSETQKFLTHSTIPVLVCR
jgi:nucleotide-binding universal stress UspA family protein